jgi:flagellin
MISGLNSSSLALAQRTASKARATMDTMTRQIATGQKVSSVKDNGAVWAQANALRSQQVTAEARGGVMDRIDMMLGFSNTYLNQAIDGLDRLRELTIEARQYAAGSTQRQALQAEWAQALSYVSVGDPTPDFVYSAAHWDQTDYNNFGFDFSAVDPLLGNNRWALSWTSNNFANWYASPSPVPLTSVNLATANTALLDQAFTSASMMRDQARERWGVSQGQDMRAIERLQVFNTAEINRLGGAIGALTDADLGKASTTRAKAETRQQLALDTVRTAISAYGNYASGLLGNVARTQRGLLA